MHTERLKETRVATLQNLHVLYQGTAAAKLFKKTAGVKIIAKVN